MLQPVAPPRGLRGKDSWGDGAFNAPRQQEGRHYGHEGLDFLANPGDRILAPISGLVTRIGLAYSDPKSTLCSLHIEGRAAFTGTRAKLLYVLSRDGVAPQASWVSAGEDIATAQDVAAYHMGRHPEKGVMLNHVHLELRIRKGTEWTLVNPADHLAALACG